MTDTLPMPGRAIRRLEDARTKKCHGCFFGRGWVEVRSTYPGHDKAVICPVCQGTGKQRKTDDG